MKKHLFAVLAVLVLTATGALAAGYDNFADGLSAASERDDDRAIALFTSALAAGDLSPNLVPAAYLQRGLAHSRKHECALAVLDYSAALKIKADYFEALIYRAAAEECAGSDADAVADYGHAISLRNEPGLYRARGFARWRMADFTGASGDFLQAVQLENDNKDPYAVLWFVMTKKRMGEADDKVLADAMSDVDLVGWPGPLLKLFSGKEAADAIEAEAKRGDAKTATGRECEAHFYLAEWWIAQSNVGAAQPLLESAIATCPHDFVEYPAAQREVARLKDHP